MRYVPRAHPQAPEAADASSAQFDKDTPREIRTRVMHEHPVRSHGAGGGAGGLSGIVPGERASAIDLGFKQQEVEHMRQKESPYPEVSIGGSPPMERGLHGGSGSKMGNQRLKTQAFQSHKDSHTRANKQMQGDSSAPRGHHHGSGH